MPRASFKLMLVALVLTTSCSNRATTGSEGSYAFQSSLQQINSHNYEGAIATLEPLAKSDPQNVEVKTKLMHAYAGAAGFEAQSFKDTLERTQQKKSRSLKDALDDFKRFHSLNQITVDQLHAFRARKATKALLESVDQIPLLSQKQFMRLNQAIDLYEHSGFSYRTSSKEDNFQWGLMYSYRMVSNLRYVAEELNKMAEGKSKRDNRSVERLALRTWNMISWDAFHAYKLFRHSYNRLQEIGQAIEDYLMRISGRRLNARLLDESNSAMDVVQYFIDENKDITADLLRRVEARIRAGNFDSTIADAFREFRHESPEVRFIHERMRAVIRTYLDEFEGDHQADLKEIRELFDDQLRAEVRQAYVDSLKEENLDAFSRLYRDPRSHFRRAYDIADLLASDVDTDRLDTELKPLVLALRDRVDQHQLRMAGEEAEATGHAIRDILEEERADYKANFEYLKQRLAAHGRNAQKIVDEELVQPAKPLTDTLRRGDGEFKKKSGEHVRRIKNYLNR